MVEKVNFYLEEAKINLAEIIYFSDRNTLDHYNKFSFVEISKIIEKKYETNLNFVKINNKEVIEINDKKTMII